MYYGKFLFLTVFALLSCVPFMGLQANEASLQQAEQAFAAGKYYQAERIYQRLLFAEPENNELRLALARCYLMENRPKAALAEISALPESVTDRSDVLLLLGDVHMALGQWELARQRFDAITRSQPENHQAYLRLADALLRLGRQEEAEALMSAHAGASAR